MMSKLYHGTLVYRSLDLDPRMVCMVRKRPDLAAHNTARIGKEFHTEESKQKIRDAMTGENNPMYGGTHTEEAKRKIAESGCNKGKWLGRKHSEESKQKMREAKMKKREE